MSYDATILADSPAVFWPLNDASGSTIVDASGNGRDGTLVGVAGHTFGEPGLLAADPTARSLGMVAVHIGRASVPGPGKGDFAIEGWFSTSNTTSSKTIVSLLGPSPAASLIIYGTASYFFSASSVVTGPTTLCDGVPHHIAGVRASGMLRLYVDGAAFGAPVADSTDYGPTPTFDGADAGYGSAHFAGHLQKLAYYDHALTATRVRAHYSAGIGAGGRMATTYALTGPTSGAASTAPTNFTVTPDGATSGTITPATTGAGTFSPTSLTWAGDSSAKTFTYTPSTAAGSPHSISIASDDGLSISGSPIAYAVAAPPALAAGTASVSAVGYGTATVASGPATGGTGPYTYQWSRSTTSGSGYSAVPGATSLTLADTGLANGTAYHYRLTAIDAASATAIGNEVSATPSATATATFAASHSAVLRCGQINTGYTAGRVADELISIGSGYDFTVANCTLLELSVYTSDAAAVVAASVDGGDYSALTLPAAGTWGDVAVFSGLSKSAHSVSIRTRYGTGHSWRTVAIDATSTFKASNVGNATTPTIAATVAGPAYVVSGARFRRNSSVDGPTSVVPGYNTGSYDSPVLDWPVFTGQRVAWRSTGTALRAFMALQGQRFSFLIDGVVTGAQIVVPNSGGNDWVAIAAGLDGAEHEYAIQSDLPGIFQLFAVQVVGGALADHAFPAAGNLVVFGDSISVGTGTTRASRGFAAQVARATNRRLLNMAIAGSTVSANVEGGRPGTIQELAGEYLAYCPTGWDTSRDEVVILAGFNDIDYIGDLQAFQAGYATILANLAATGAKVHVLGILPTAAAPASTSRTAWNSALSAQVAALGNPNIAYHSTDGVVNTTTDLADSIHLSQSGDDKVAAWLGGMVTTWAAPAGSVTPPVAADVRSGVDRGDGIPGTLVVPAAGDVRSGTTYNNGTVGTYAATGGSSGVIKRRPRTIGAS